MWRNGFVVLLLMLLAMPGWSHGRARGADRIEWEVIGVDGLDYICFTTRSGGIDCHPAGADPCVIQRPPPLIPQLGRGPGAWDPRAGIESQVVDVDGVEFVCFTTRRGAISCDRRCDDFDPEFPGR